MDIYANVVKSITKQLDKELRELDMEKRLVEDLHADSLDIVMMAMDYEEDFGIRIPERDMSDLCTIGDVVKYLESRVDG